MFKKCRALLGAKVRKGAGIYKNKCFVPLVFKKCRALLGAKVTKTQGY